MDWFLYDNGLCHERVKYVFDSYSILIIIFILKKIFSASIIFSSKDIYVITHTAKTHLPCSILKCFNQVYESNERKTFLLTNTKLCRTQTSFDSLNCIYNKKAHMLNIFYSLKTINVLKIKRVILKHGVPIGIP